ncbi:uncharacterized protein LOC126857261 [Cataglyphis hispanica]|uniref:uncharacterized protein LOC126857261 n=1 Tax=Cataglyphis hispanica TaxID=1086592 RepID=UPI0021809117|nr:uncharacterized protein LOC126857261 [Cataglyphis hispanica]
MKDIHLVVILYVATLSVAFSISSVTDFPIECPTDDDSQDKIIYIPHENDCTKFYSCYMGTKGKPQDCPFMDNKGNRLHFNPVLQVCDWPWSAGCRTTSTSTTSTSSLTPSTSPSSSPTITSSSSFSTSSTSSSNPPTTSTLPSSSSTLPTLSSSSSISPTSSSTSRTTMTSSSSTSTTPTLLPNSSTSSSSPTMTSLSSSPPTSSSSPLTTPTLPPSSSTSPSSSSISPTSSSTSRTTVISSSSTSTTPTVPPNSSTSSSSPTMTTSSSSSSPTSSSSPLTTPTLPPSSSTSPSSSSISPTSSSTSRTTVISSSSTSTTPTLPPNSSTSSSSSTMTTPSSSSPPTSSSSSLTTPTLPPSSSTSPSSSSISPTSSSTSRTTVISSSSTSTTPTLPPNSSTSSSSSTMTTPSSSSPPTSSSSSLTTPTLPPSSSTSPSSSSISPTSSSTSRTTVISSSSTSTTPTVPPNSSTSSSSPTMTTSSSSSSPTSSSSPLTTPTLPPSSSTSPSSSSISPTSSSTSRTTVISSSSTSTTPTLPPNSSTSSSSSTMTTPSSSSPPTSSSSSLTTPTLPPSSSNSPSSSSISPTSSSTSRTTVISSSSTSTTPTLPPNSSTSSSSPTMTTSSSSSPPTSSSSPLTTRTLPPSSSTSPSSSSISPTLSSTSPTTMTSSSSSPTTPISSSSPSTTLTSSSASPMTTLSSSSLSTMIITTASTMITTAISTTTTQASEKPRTKCPPKESTEIALIAHPCLCNVYYKCEKGVKISQTCPDEMHFDYVREICDFPEKVNCVRPIRTVDILMGSCNKCGPEGRAFQHESDCSSYYLCSNGTKILKHCMAGLYFNVTLQMCDYPTKTDCDLIPKFLTTAKFLTAHSVNLGDCPPAGSTEKVLLPHECKCDQYYECVNERKALRYCEDGLHFDNDRNTCSHPNDAKCPYVCPCTTEKILLPHEYNCEQYYECVNREQVLQTCPDNQHFDYINKTCKHPDEAICATSNSTTTTKTTTETTITNTTTTEITTTETPITTTPTTTTTENIPEKPRKTCPPAGSTEKARIGHPWVCIWYYECVNGKPKFQTCNIFKLEAFDYILEECVVFWKAKCRWPISTYDILIDDYNNKCSQEGRAFWHKTDSSLYYLCVNGKKILKHCPAGLHFNVTLQMCDYPTKTHGDLTSKFLTTAKFLTAHSVNLRDCPPAGSTEKILLPHECKCDQYYECVNERKVLRYCEDGLHFDHNKNTCSHPNDAECPNVCLCVTEKTLLPHECNCEQYYECVEGKQALRTCLNNQYFDYIDKTCKHSDEANCATVNSTTTPTTTTEITTTEITTTETTTTKTTTTETTTTETTTTETTITETPITTTSTTTETPITTTPTTTETPITTTPITTTTENIPEKPRKTCPPPGSTEKARIAHPMVCNKYYECINGEKVEQKCSNGMEFDYIREVCDWFWIVKCIRPIPTYDISTFTSIISTIKWPEETYKIATNNLDPATCIGTCPEVDPPVAVLLPNEDCKKFCMCSNGIAWVQSCPEPLYFDSIDKVCKYKKDAVCGKRLFNQDHVSMLHSIVNVENSMQSLNNNNKDKQEIYDNSWSTVRIYNLDPVTCIGTCPEEDPPFAVLLPNEDCKKFCMCSNGIAWVQSCPEPLYFDSKDKICKNKRDAVCAKRLFYQDHASMLHKKIDDENSMQSLNNKNNDEQEVRENSWSTVRIYNLDPVTCIGTCPEEDPPFAVLLPNEDCKKFCMCSNGIAWVQSCPEPLYFDSKDKICKNKRDAVCAKRLFYQDHASMLHKKIDDENSMQSLNNKNNDEQEVRENSWSTVRIYNLDPVTCIGTCPEEDPPFAVLLPNEDCKKFCMCSNGIAWVQSCPEPLYFDSKDKICKNKRDAVCAKRLFYQDHASMLHKKIDDENSMQSLNNKNNDEQEVHENSWSTVHIYNLDPVTCIGTCPEEDPPFAVLLPNEDCKKFCMCSNGIAWVQSCPEPLYFDSKDKICKNKRDAVCAVRPFN